MIRWMYGIGKILYIHFAISEQAYINELHNNFDFGKEELYEHTNSM